MLPYWLLFAYFAAGTLLSGIRAPETVGAAAGPFVYDRRQTSAFLLGGALLIIVMVGFRWQVGTDWYAYVDKFRFAALKPLNYLTAIGEPGYVFVNWFVQQLGAGFWLVNVICAVLFTWGLYRLASVQPDPWAAILVAIPYLVVVVAMGYVRQGVAIGILMAGLAHLIRGGSVPKFLFYIAAAALFHRTAVLALPLVMFGIGRGRLVNFLTFLAVGYVLFDTLLQRHARVFIRSYLETQYSSQGAAIRVAMCLVPALLYVFFRNRLGLSPVERTMWRNFAVAAFIALLLLLVTPSSTAVDRMALYILPLQLAILSRLNLVLQNRVVASAVVIGYSGLVLYVWLNFATFAVDWIPYQFYPLS